MESNFQRIRLLIAKSDLSKEDQDNLMVLYSQAGDDDLASVAELFAQDALWIEKISRNIRAKQQAFEQGDHRQWSDILEEEKRWIAEII